MFLGRDNGAYSLTIQALLEQNARCVTHEDTYYFSYVTDQTTSGYLSGHAYPKPDMNPFIVPTSLYMGRKDFARPFYLGFRSKDWWPNDGLVSTWSQRYPHTAGQHPIGGEFQDGTSFEPGRWYYRSLDDVDHVDVVALPQLNQVGC